MFTYFSFLKRFKGKISSWKKKLITNNRKYALKLMTEFYSFNYSNYSYILFIKINLESDLKIKF